MILVVGVNGTGKTTTIGKLAAKLSEHGRCVLVAAADTFRAAAEEQLDLGSRAQERTSSARSAAATPQPSPTTRSRRRRRAAATS